MSLFCWTQRKIFWRMWETEQFWGTIDFHSIFFPTMEVNGAPKQPGYKLSSKYLPLCSAEQRHSYRFGTTWGWVNDDRIFIFGWTIPLMVLQTIYKEMYCSSMSFPGSPNAQKCYFPNANNLCKMYKLCTIKSIYITVAITQMLYFMNNFMLNF